MEEQSPIVVLMSREQLLLVITAVILAGMAANYSTVCPATMHATVAKGLAQDLLDAIQKGQE